MVKFNSHQKKKHLFTHNKICTTKSCVEIFTQWVMPKCKFIMKFLSQWLILIGSTKIPMKTSSFTFVTPNPDAQRIPSIHYIRIGISHNHPYLVISFRKWLIWKEISKIKLNQKHFIVFILLIITWLEIGNLITLMWSSKIDSKIAIALCVFNWEIAVKCGSLR